MENLVESYNSLAFRLQLVPETAEFANGKDFSLKVGFNSDIEGKFDNFIKVSYSVVLLHYISLTLTPAMPVLALNGINLRLFKISFQYILAR